LSYRQEVYKLNRTGKIVIGAVALVVFTALTVFYVTSYFILDFYNIDPEYSILFDPDEVDKNSVRKFIQVKELLEQGFYQEVDTDTLLEGAVAGMADSLQDPYTVYFTKEQMQLFNEKSKGSYVGIGVVVTMGQDGLLTVVEPFENSPADKVGIKKGDKIIEVDGEDVTGERDSDLIVSMIKGEENTKVKITVYRPSENSPIEFEIIRQRMKTINITSEVLPGNIGYIMLKMFDEEAGQDFNRLLDELLGKRVRGLIIDVRDNPGGSYAAVVKIVDRIVPEGLIVYTEDRNGKRQEERSKPDELDIPVVVLTNGNSASASEILAGALKDHKKATIIGTKTFGKGLVQGAYTLEDGSGIKVTISRYFTPSGQCIHGVGIEPDITVELPDDYRDVPVSQVPREEDTQLEKAIQVINKIG
jgi:carboxyl-terminal processing protease